MIETPIRFKIHCSKEIEFPDDFNDLVPESYTGKCLNYGQGEGQVQIGDTVWGFYYGSDNGVIQFEEGSISWEDFIIITNAIKKHIEKIMSCSIDLFLEGAFNNGADIVPSKEFESIKPWWKFWKR